MKRPKTKRAKRMKTARRGGNGASIRNDSVESKSRSLSMQPDKAASVKDSKTEILDVLNENGLNLDVIETQCEKKNAWNSWMNLSTLWFYRRQYNLETCKKKMFSRKLKKMKKDKREKFNQLLNCNTDSECFDMFNDPHSLVANIEKKNINEKIYKHINCKEDDIECINKTKEKIKKEYEELIRKEKEEKQQRISRQETNTNILLVDNQKNEYTELGELLQKLLDYCTVNDQTKSFFRKKLTFKELYNLLTTDKPEELFQLCRTFEKYEKLIYGELVNLAKTNKNILNESAVYVLSKLMDWRNENVNNLSKSTPEFTARLDEDNEILQTTTFKVMTHINPVVQHYITRSNRKK